MPANAISPDWDLYLPQAVRSRHSLDDLPEQFVCAEQPQGTSSWPEHRLGSWVLKRHPTLRVMSLSTDARQLGWLLGYAIPPSGELLKDSATVMVKAATGSAIHEVLDSLGGRWVAVLVEGPQPHVRLDPSGSLSVVFDAGRRIVASTPNLIPYGPGYEDDVDLVRAIGIPWVDSRFPLTLTPRRGVVRLLPNHVLDLDDFRPRRTWPTDDIEVDTDVDGSVQRIAGLVRRNVGALVKDGPCSLPLTSGKDSRMILACARQWAPELMIYTMHLEAWASEMDARVAHRVAAGVGLDHRTVPHLEPTAEDLDEWLFRVSCATIAQRGWRASTSFKTLDRRLIRLIGAIGELGRARHWRPEDRADTVITPERLLGVYHIPVTEQTRSVVVEWLDGLPTENAFTTLNLFYIEFACWGGLFPYADYAGPGFTIFPLAHAEIVRGLMSLPWEIQRQADFPQRVIAREWPELLSLPFGRDSGWQRIYLLPRWYGAVKRRASSAYRARRS